MNKFTSIVTESKSFEQIENHIIPISDILGKHSVATLKFGDGDGYIFKWKLPFEITQYNGSNELDSILRVFDCIKRLQSTITRLDSYIIDFKIDSNHLSVRITPKSESDGQEYKFIVGQNWRNVILDYSQIHKFFRDQGYTIRNTKIEDNEYEETSSVYIITDAPDYVTKQFADDFLSEFNYEYIDEETINRRINCTNNGGMVYIFPEDEKTFVIFNQSI